jgi:hypothetical protein
MVPRARCWRVHSALTHKVNAIEAINDRLHAACEGIQSGQLPFLGLSRGRAERSGTVPSRMQASVRLAQRF